jgi:hypothetical protein
VQTPGAVFAIWFAGQVIAQGTTLTVKVQVASGL